MGVFSGIKSMTRPEWKLSIRTAMMLVRDFQKQERADLHSWANTDTSADSE